MKNRVLSAQGGFSVVEVMLAVSLFVVFSIGMVTVLLRGVDNNRTASEQLVATEYASEGLEAVRSISNQAFTNLVLATSAGVTRSGAGVWAFSGESNTFEKFTRQISVLSVERDGGGNIVTTGGTVDEETKKVVATVSWNIGPARTSSVVLITYLTNWRAAIGVGPSGTCNEYAVQQGYASGVCRQNVQQCVNNGEIPLVSGDVYCTSSPSYDTCCVPPSVTITPTPTMTPTPTPTPASCSQACAQNGQTSGTCRTNPGACSSRGETHVSTGDVFCTGGPSADTCCCL